MFGLGQLGAGFGRMGAGGGGPVGFTAEAETLFAAMEVQPDDTRKALINDTIRLLKSVGIWDRMDVIHIRAAHTEQAAHLNWKDPDTFTSSNVNMVTFTADEGHAGNGTDSYVNLNWAPTDGVNYTQNDATFWIWDNTPDQSTLSIAGTGTAAVVTIVPRNGSNQMVFRLNTSTASTIASSTDGSGLSSIRRTASTATKAYKNGAPLHLGASTTSAAVSSSQINLGRINTTTFNSHQFAADGLGASLTDQQTADLYDILNTYMTGVSPFLVIGSALLWSPPTLVNPIEPGTVRDDTKPGTGIKTIIPVGFHAWTIPTEQDALVVGSEHVTAGTRTGQFQPTGGRNVIIRGFESNAQRLLCGMTNAEHWFIEGVRGDRSPDSNVIDALFVGGNGGPIITIQHCHFRGIHGTNFSQFFEGAPNSAEIVGISVAGGVATVELAAPFPEGSPITGRIVIIGLTAFNGTDTTPLRNFNYNWEIGTVVDSTHFTLVVDQDNVIPPNGSTATGGTAWMMQETVEIHGDGTQLNTGTQPSEMRIDKCTYKVNTRGIIVQSAGPIFKFSRCNTDLDLTYDPQDNNTFTYWSNDSNVVDWQDFWLETRDKPDGSGKRDLENNINPQTGIATVVGDERRISFEEAHLTGYINQGVPPGGDFAPYDDCGVGYVSPGYWLFPAPTASDLPDITVDNLAATTALAENGHIGWVDAVHSLTGQIVDIHISAGDTTRIKLSGREMVRGSVALVAGSLPFELTATVRGTGITLAKEFSLEVS